MDAVINNDTYFGAVGIIEFGKGEALRQVASASIVKGLKESIIATAAHCIYNFKKKEFYEDIFFTPLHCGTKKFRPVAVAIPMEFVEQTDLEYDTCFLIMEDSFNKTKEYYDIALNICFNLPRGLEYCVCGYSGGITQLTKTGGKAVKDIYKNSSLQGVPCLEKDGLSGGPWITKYKDKIVQNSISILSINSVKNIMWGPYWGTSIENAYLAIQNSQLNIIGIQVHYFE